MFESIRSKLISSILIVAISVGIVSLFVGIHLLYKAVVNEATNRVSLDLNSAREIYLNEIRTIESALSITCLGSGFRSAVKERDITELMIRLDNLSAGAGLDFAGISTADSKILCLMGKGLTQEVQWRTVKIENPIAEIAFKRMVAVSGTFILSNDFLDAHSPELANRVVIRFIDTPRAVSGIKTEEKSGMTLAAGVPIVSENKVIGVLYGGVLLNRNQSIVDRIRNTVFQNEIYKDRSIGTATIFFEDIRISTNVLTPDGKRAVGTRVSEEVRNHVLNNGKKWSARAFVVNDWYITAYEPIEDFFGKRVGMLYVGVLDKKYADMRSHAIFIFIIITLIGMMFSVIFGYILAKSFIQPINKMIEASKMVSKGNFTPDIGPVSNGEIGILQRTFAETLSYLDERYRRQKAESEIQLVQSEKQASIGKLAAGVAHEINNPLTGVLTYSHMLLRRKDIADDVRSDIEVILEATQRVKKIVKGLLDFSRQTEIETRPTDVNKLVDSTISILKNEALIKGLSLDFDPGFNLPNLTLDQNQIQSVIMNIIINAIEATDPGGEIKVITGIELFTVEKDQLAKKGVIIEIKDTGCGIPAKNLERLFDPFFTTKEIGYGTGLGLSVSYGIIERHGGKIIVESQVGKGSVFSIWLPIIEENEEEKDPDNR